MHYLYKFLYFENIRNIFRVVVYQHRFDILIYHKLNILFDSIVFHGGFFKDICYQVCVFDEITKSHREGWG